MKTRGCAARTTSTARAAATVSSASATAGAASAAAAARPSKRDQPSNTFRTPVDQTRTTDKRSPTLPGRSYLCARSVASGDRTERDFANRFRREFEGIVVCKCLSQSRRTAVARAKQRECGARRNRERIGVPQFLLRTAKSEYFHKVRSPNLRYTQ